MKFIDFKRVYSPRMLRSRRTIHNESRRIRGRCARVCQSDDLIAICRCASPHIVWDYRCPSTKCITIWGKKMEAAVYVNATSYIHRLRVGARTLRASQNDIISQRRVARRAEKHDTLLSTRPLRADARCFLGKLLSVMPRQLFNEFIVNRWRHYFPLSNFHV